MKFKPLVYLLTALFLLSPLFVFSSCDTENSAVLSYEKTEKGWTVVSLASRSSSVRVPESHEGEPVVAIADNAFYANGMLRRVALPQTLCEIGEYAFADCGALVSVEISPGGACAVGDHAFENCTALRTLRLNGSVCSVGEAAFKNCRMLTEIKAGKELTEIGSDAFMNCERLIVRAHSGTVLAEYAKNNSLSTDFFSSIYAVYLPAAGALAFGIALLFGARAYMKRKKRRKATEPDHLSRS